MHLITACSAMLLAARGIPPIPTLFITLIGGGLVAAASNVLNCYFDRDIDRLMGRTSRRPLPTVRIRPSAALIYAFTLGLIGILWLALKISPLAAALAAGALVYYVVFYTLVLKRNTYFSAVIGSGVGAFPPLIGWVAVTGNFSIVPILLGLIVIFWTLPHFWSLTTLRREEYERAGIAVPTQAAATWSICVSTILLIITTSIMGISAHLGIFYIIIQAVLGATFVFLAFRLLILKTSAAYNLYIYSIIYLGLLFGTAALSSVL
jgi:protoheme IX farnesyltransferase